MQFVENEVKEIGPGVWIRVAVDNISWCELGDGAVVFDALEDPEQADVVRGLIKETTGQELRWIINTHWDPDHIACNPQWRREGVVAIAHESCAASAGDWEGAPDVSFADRAMLRGLKGRRVEMEWVGGTHTAWDTLLYMPHARVLHIADLFGWGLIPCPPSPARVRRLRSVLGKVLSYQADALICGHGPVLKMDQVRRFMAYLDMMLEEVPTRAAAGADLEKIAGELPPPEDMHDWWRFTDWKHSKNIELILQHYQK